MNEIMLLIIMALAWACVMFGLCWLTNARRWRRHERRAEALRLSDHHGDPPEDVLARARAYLDFLEGQTP